MGHFRREWSNQTELGRQFGISAREVGKFLIAAELKDPGSKYATAKALSSGTARLTPLKDGTPFFMWNVQKVRQLISVTHEPLSPIDLQARDVFQSMKDIDRWYREGHDKMATITQDCLYAGVPNNIREKVKKRAEAMFLRFEIESPNI